VRRLAVVAIVAASAAAGCSGDEEDAPEQVRGPTEVRTTRVEVVEGIGRRGGLDAGGIYERLSPGVVTVLSIFDDGSQALDDEGTGGQGSGFVLDAEGYVATNAHVVTGEGSNADRADDVYVEFSDGNRVAAEIVGVDPFADVALLRVSPSGLSLTPLSLGSSDRIRVGEPVAAIGSPFGERQSLTVGVISALDRNIRSLTRFGIGDAIQTDASINPGNSGGPLLDGRGRVLGINAQIKSSSGGGEGVGFAIPVDAVRRSLRELRSDGRVDYGYLGLTTLPLWPQLADRLDLDSPDGALVVEVSGGSPADDAGLEAGKEEITFQGQDQIVAGGDVVLAVDGRRLTRTRDLSDAISARSAGEKVTLTVVRDGDRREIEVELGPRPAGAGG